MQHAEDLKLLADVVEADAVVAEAEAQFQRLDIGQAFDVAVTVKNEIGQGFEQSKGRLAVDAPHVGAGLWRPLDSFRHGCGKKCSAPAALSALFAHAAEVVRTETKIC